jgi:hypothetical protein
MSNSPIPLPIPGTLRSVDDALGAAKNAGLSNVLIISEKSADEFVLIHAGAGDPLTAAQCLWLLAKAQQLLLTPGNCA